MLATIGLIIFRVLSVYMWVLFARAILSWLPLIFPGFTPKGIVLVLFEIIYTLTDPPLKLAHRLLPPLRIGGVGIDLGFILVVVAVLIAQRVVLIVFF